MFSSLRCRGRVPEGWRMSHDENPQMGWMASEDERTAHWNIYFGLRRTFIDGDRNDVEEVFLALHTIQVKGTGILAGRKITGFDRID
ncbi:hypothetical protein CEXT_560261 [Caerostris extrusa]|uniref:Uncharacterized protein n=1 Tax=Caerostris extrusa TaxID=172846 RepID=A0AAV4MJU5_CAEEX|nr:hypothetical protein CEXT_560261 [Caerostris extrusa]